MTRRIRARHSQTGFNLVELMVSLTIGLFIMLAVSTMFLGASRSEREYSKLAQKVENGRYAIDAIIRDLWHAGFYGYIGTVPSVPPTEPDPCEVADTAKMYAALPDHVQVFWAPDWATAADLSKTTCNIPNLMPGSDVLVVRRANTQALLPTDTTEVNDVYVQTVPDGGEIQIGSGQLVGTDKRANGQPAANPPSLLKADGTAAQIYKYHVHIYYVSRCSNPSGAAGTCAAGDDGGTWVPSLRRLELAPAGASATMRNIAIADGIEVMRVDLGIDNTPSDVNPVTQRNGDGMADTYIGKSAQRSQDFANAVSARVWVVSRNAQPTPGYVDQKVLNLGSISGDKPAAGDGFPRSLFSREVMIANPAMRRQIP